jgi:tetratricopeptide (TPR) repeat protein
VIRVFLSSTARDLAAYRKAVDDVIRDLRDFYCFPMENFGAQDAPPSDFCRDEVERCDVFVAIIGQCYGSRPGPDRPSFTHAEYDAAKAAGKPCLLFVAPDDFPTPANLIRAMSEADHAAQKTFRDQAMAERVSGTFADPAGLAQSVVTALSNWRIAKLEKDHGVSEAHVRRFLADIEGREVPAHEVDARLQEIAGRYKEQLARNQPPTAADPQGTDLRRRARAALEKGEFDSAEALLDEARNAELAAASRLEETMSAHRAAAADATFETGDLLMTRLRYAPAAARFADAVALTPETGEALLATRLLHWGIAAWCAGASLTAVAAHRRLLAIRERLEPPDSLELAGALGLLALSLKQAGQLDEAERLYRRELVIRDRPGTQPDRNLANALSNYGTLLHSVRRFQEAEPLLQRAVEIGEGLLGPDHADVGGWVQNLGGVLFSLGDTDRAESLLRRGLAIGEKTLAPDHPNLATRLANLGYLLMSTGRAPEAEPLYERAAAIREAVLPPGHSQLAMVHSDMGDLYAALGRPEEAAAHRARADAVRPPGRPAS